MKNAAYKQYLNSLDVDTAKKHIMTGIMSGGELAFDLIAEVDPDYQGFGTDQCIEKCIQFIKKEIEEKNV